MQEYGYDLFNINDLFYQDICTQLLSVRKNDFYDNETKCQENCKYSSYISESKYLNANVILILKILIQMNLKNLI